MTLSLGTLSSSAIILVMEWDEMIYFMDAECGSGSSISFTLRDHMSISVLERIWGPGAVRWAPWAPYLSFWRIHPNCDLHGRIDVLEVRIAGGITQSWTL